MIKMSRDSILTTIKKKLSEPTGRTTDILMVLTFLFFLVGAWCPIMIKNISFATELRVSFWLTAVASGVATYISMSAESSE